MSTFPIVYQLNVWTLVSGILVISKMCKYLPVSSEINIELVFLFVCSTLQINKEDLHWMSVKRTNKMSGKKLQNYWRKP